MNSETLDKSEVKEQAKKPSYGKYLLVFMLLAGIFNTFEQNIQPHSLSAFSAFLVTGLRIILDTGVLYLLVLWIAALIRRRGGIDRPENKKVRMVINIVFAVIFLLIIVSVLMVVKKSPSAELNPEQTSFVNQLLEKNQEFSSENSGVKVATQSLLNILNNQEWSKMHSAL